MGDLTDEELELLDTAGKLAKERHRAANPEPEVTKPATMRVMLDSMVADIQREFVPIPEPPKRPDPTPEERAAREARRAENRAARKDQYLWEARYPKKYRWALEDPAIATTLRLDASKLAKATATPAEGNYALTGPTGAGKTTAGCLILASLIAEEGGGMFVSAYELERERRTTPLGEGDGELLHAALRARVLLLDDVGAEQNGTFSPIVDLVFHRYDRELQTIVTTGIGKSELVARYGTGFVRRVFERVFAWDLGGKP